LFFASVATHAVLHRVSIRTFVSLAGSVPVEVQLEKSMLPVFGRSHYDPIPCAVTGTRGRRNKSALFSIKLQLRRTVCTPPG
jgi:hypothetical protein